MAGSCHTEDNMGSSVKLTNIEMSTAATMVMPPRLYGPAAGNDLTYWGAGFVVDNGQSVLVDPGVVLKTADGKARLLRVIAPLGVLLPAGLGLKVDQTDVGRAGFVRCLNSGCVAEVVMEDKLIEQLGAGKNATFIIFNTPEEGIGIPLALDGFRDGFTKLP